MLQTPVVPPAAYSAEDDRLFRRNVTGDFADTHPLLSCYDIQILLAKTLPDRRSSEEEVLKQMQIRHQQRQALIDYARSG